MYESYWNLNEKPFQNTFNPDYLFYSPTHEEALVRLLYTVSESKGLMLLTGEGGCGKTFLCKTFIKELLENGFKVAYLSNPDLEAVELLREIFCELGLDGKGKTKNELLRELREFASEVAKQGSGCVLVIDEAQLISDGRTLEEIRLLLNFEKDGRFLFSIILAGQNALARTVRNIPSLRERVGLQYRLLPLTREETGEYIIFRMDKAGARSEIVLPEAINDIYTGSRGIPREINNICDMALLIGCGEETGVIDRKVVLKALQDYRGDELESRRLP